MKCLPLFKFEKYVLEIECVKFVAGYVTEFLKIDRRRIMKVKIIDGAFSRFDSESFIKNRKVNVLW